MTVLTEDKCDDMTGRPCTGSGDFNAKVGTEDVLKAAIRNESLHEISNDVRVQHS
jgi:hypothetical protein